MITMSQNGKGGGHPGVCGYSSEEVRADALCSSRPVDASICFYPSAAVRRTRGSPASYRKDICPLDGKIRNMKKPQTIAGISPVSPSSLERNDDAPVDARRWCPSRRWPGYRIGHTYIHRPPCAPSSVDRDWPPAGSADEARAIAEGDDLNIAIRETRVHLFPVCPEVAGPNTPPNVPAYSTCPLPPERGHSCGQTSIGSSPLGRHLWNDQLPPRRFPQKELYHPQ